MQTTITPQLASLFWFSFQWPSGLANVPFSNSIISSANEIEVEISLNVSAAGLTSGRLGSCSFASADESSQTMHLDEEEWAVLVPRLASRAVFSFPLNPLKEIVRELRGFDEQRP